MRDIEQGTGALLVEEGASSGVRDRHGVGVRGVGVAGLVELGGVDVVVGAVGEDGIAIGIVPDEADGFEGEGGAEFGEIFEDVVGATAVAGGFRADIGEHVLGGISVDHFDVIDDEIPAGEDAGARGAGRRGGGHGESCRYYIGLSGLRELF